MNRYLQLSFAILIFTCLVMDFSFGKPKEINWPQAYSQELFHITEVMVTDVASPPVAARIYAYSTLATYLISKEAGKQFEHQDILGQTYLADQNREVENPEISSPEFAAIYAMLKVGEAIMPSGYLLKEKQQDWINTALKRKFN